MKKLLYIFVVLTTIIMSSCDLEDTRKDIVIKTSDWILTKIDSITILCVPRYSSIKPFIIKTNNNEIN